jgi:hypothetical protein
VRHESQVKVAVAAMVTIAAALALSSRKVRLGR